MGILKVRDMLLCYIRGDISNTHGQPQQTVEGDVKNNILIRAFYLLFALMSVSPLVYLKDDMQNGRVMLWTVIFLLGYAGVIGVYCFMMKRIGPVLKQRDWLILLCAVAAAGLLLRWGALCFFQTQPISDFGTPFAFYRHYKAHGPYTEVVPWEQRDIFQLYYSRFPAWFPYMRVIMLIYDLFGENLLWMNLFNMLLAGGSIVIIYFTIPEKTTALLAALLFAVNPSLVAYSCVMAPDHITIFLFLLTVFFWTRLEHNREDWLHNAKWRIYALAVILCCVLINLFKPLSILFAVVFICYESAAHLYPALRARGPLKRLWKELLSMELAFLLLLLCGIAACNAGLKHSVERMLQTETVDSTGYYFLVGYSVNEDGKYDTNVGNRILIDTFEKYENDYTKVFPEIEKLAKEQIKRNLSLLPGIWGAKHQCAFSNEWLYYEFSNTSADKDYQVSLGKACSIPITTAMLTMMRLLYVLSAIFALMEMTRKRVDKQMLLVAIIVFGYILVLLLGGVQSRYKSLVVSLWCMVSAYTLCTLYIRSPKSDPKM